MADLSSKQNNVDQTKIWTEKNIFTKNVTFCSDQIFPLERLSYNNYPTGTILFANGTQWDVLKPAKNNHVLTFTGRGLSWQAQSLSAAEGVLPVSKGGTGWSLFPDNGILINTGKEVLDLIPLPLERKVLVGENKFLNWIKLSELTEEITKNFKTIRTNGSDAIFEEFNPTILLKDQQIYGGLNLNFRNSSFNIGVNSEEIKNINGKFSSLNLKFDYNSKTINFEIDKKSIFHLDSNANLTNAFIDAKQIKGTIDTSQGGLGDLKFESGDLIFAKSSRELGVVSSNNAEGCYLQVLNGIPTFVNLDKSGFDGILDVPLVLQQSKNNSAPLKFKKSALIKQPTEGSVEFDGKNLFLTNDEGRRTVAYLSSDITGKSSNVTGIININNGGTGQDLTNLSIGQILIKNHEAISSFEQGSFGQVLMSQGECTLPTWRDAVLDVDTKPESGIALNRNSGVVDLSVDQSINFNPTWQGDHKFVKPLELKSKLFVSDRNNAPLNFEINENVRDISTGDVWFDGKNLNFFDGAETIKLNSSNSTQQKSTNEFIQSHYLTLAAGADVSEGRKIRMKTPVPHMSTKGSLAQANWKLRKLEIILDETPSEEPAVFNLKCGNKILIDSGTVSINTEITSFENFDYNVVSTGEILQLECIKSGGSNYWSAFLLIDLL